jgi:Ca2+-transporting ATPase
VTDDATRVADSPVRLGLAEDEVLERRKRFGVNEVRVAHPTVLARLLAVARDPLILVLLVAAALTIATKDFADAVIILTVVVFNTAVGLIQELRAEQAIAALDAVAAPLARVRRGGHERQVAITELVPGDITLLREGDLVPADAAVDEAAGLLVDESTVTGESVSVSKDLVGDALWAGTTVVRGRAVVTITATGAQSSLGRLTSALSAAVRPTPLQRRLAALGRMLAIVVAALCLVVLGVGLARGENVERMLVVAISLAVAAVPESLPAVVTLSLALGARRMSHRDAIVRNLPAVETLGAVTILATDKTGTLTEGRMTASELWVPNGLDLSEMLTAAVLCNDASLSRYNEGQRPSVRLGDPMEVALLDLATDHGIEPREVRRAYPRYSEMPFDSARKRMTTVHGNKAGTFVCCKGALENMCRDGILGGSDPAVLDEAGERAGEFAECGQRVLAVAGNRSADHSAGEHDLRLLGLVAFEDPPKSSAFNTIAACKRAGITPVLITGDHPSTARSIALQVGVLDPAAGSGAVVIGGEFQDGHVHDLTVPRVFARTTPEQKLAVIEAWQDAGAVVAMTGDGVNDAPALRRADIGVSMGRRGTDVAREASDVVLADDELATLVAAVEEGRRIYSNVRRFLLYALAGGAAEILVMLLGPLVNLAVPLLASQILWINLLTHGLTGVAIGAEPATADLMARAPRSPAESILGRGLWWRILVLATVVAVVSVTLAAWAHQVGRPWQTMLFVALTSLQLSVALASRAQPRSLANPFLLLMVATSLLLVVAGVYADPLRTLLGTSNLSAGELALAIGIGMLGWMVTAAVVPTHRQVR